MTIRIQVAANRRRKRRRCDTDDIDFRIVRIVRNGKTANETVVRTTHRKWNNNPRDNNRSSKSRVRTLVCFDGICNERRRKTCHKTEETEQSNGLADIAWSSLISINWSNYSNVQYELVVIPKNVLSPFVKVNIYVIFVTMNYFFDDSVTVIYSLFCFLLCSSDCTAKLSTTSCIVIVVIGYVDREW